jgi:predicted AAA+ superfamily ATPase
MNITRYLEPEIINDALKDQKIAFITGPRQVGKTTLSENILAHSKHANQNYFSWDDEEFRKIWIKSPKNIFAGNKIIVLDEIHKDRNWKTRLKGLYDQYKKDTQIIVTGSARLDFYRKSGDSLQGRYYPYRLHPFSLNETPSTPNPPTQEWGGTLKTTYSLTEMLRFGGFPDPFFQQNFEKTKRWQRLYRERMIREDLRDLKEVKDLEQIKTLSYLLEEKVSSALSYESLRQDLKVSFDTVKSWIDLLEAVYFCYRIKPYFKDIKQAIRKEPKLYLFDWSILKDPGAQFENFIASHLLKSCHAWTDTAKGEFELHYVRDKQKREVDFLVTQNQKPWLLVEVKSSHHQISPALIHYTEILKPKFSIQVVKEIKHEFSSMAHPKIQVMDVRRFLSQLV